MSTVCMYVSMTTNMSHVHQHVTCALRMAVPYAGAEGGLLGAYGRVKQRHQNKHASNPNPHRLRQSISPHCTEPPATKLVDRQQLALILKKLNHGKPPDQMEVWQIMMQQWTDTARPGWASRCSVPTATPTAALHAQSLMHPTHNCRHGQAGGGQDAASPPVDIGCQCTVS
ncbi:hypothetical protein HaLaN_28489 [Haematococcus lacustris]|uniref:Uncharacterized protein n=1 Tax=Haematococcus lacustris TaxID=44745 RepID=A0A6A0ABY6_HAELA|nr:hypothetical protein HaLaN_28489 [Haematococcus lacustris]